MGTVECDACVARSNGLYGAVGASIGRERGGREGGKEGIEGNQLALGAHGAVFDYKVPILCTKY